MPPPQLPTKMFFWMGDTPVALCCFLRINLWLILGEMAEQGKEPFVLQGERGGYNELFMLVQLSAES